MLLPVASNGLKNHAVIAARFSHLWQSFSPLCPEAVGPEAAALPEDELSQLTRVHRYSLPGGGGGGGIQFFLWTYFLHHSDPLRF